MFSSNAKFSIVKSRLESVQTEYVNNLVKSAKVGSYAYPLAINQLLQMDSQSYNSLIELGEAAYQSIFSGTKVSTSRTPYKTAVLALLLGSFVRVYQPDGKVTWGTLSFNTLKSLGCFANADVEAEYSKKYNQPVASSNLWKKIASSGADEVPILKMKKVEDINGKLVFTPNKILSTVDLTTQYIIPVFTWVACAGVLDNYLSSSACRITHSGKQGIYTFDMAKLSDVQGMESVSAMMSFIRKGGSDPLGRIVVPRLGASSSSLGVANISVDNIDYFSVISTREYNTLVEGLKAESNVDISCIRDYVVSAPVDDNTKRGMLSELAKVPNSWASERQEDFSQLSGSQLDTIYQVAVCSATDSVVYNILSNNEQLGMAYQLGSYKTKYVSGSVYGKYKKLKDAIGVSELVDLLQQDKVVKVTYRNAKGVISTMNCTSLSNTGVISRYPCSKIMPLKDASSKLVELHKAVINLGVAESQPVPVDEIRRLAVATYTEGYIARMHKDLANETVGEFLDRISKDKESNERAKANKSKPSNENLVTVACVNAKNPTEFIKSVDITKVIEVGVYN